MIMLMAGLLAMTLLHSGGYQQYNVPRLPSAMIKAMDEDIISQIQIAQAAGEESVQVLVPESLSNAQWPLDVEMTSQRIPDSLFWQGILPEKIEVTIVPSPEKDIQYGLK